MCCLKHKSLTFTLLIPIPDVRVLKCFFPPSLIFAVYSNALQESANSILYNGLIEELVDVLQITDKQLVVSYSFSASDFHL